MVAAAVGMFIVSGNSMEEYEYLKKELFQLDYNTYTISRSRGIIFKSTYSAYSCLWRRFMRT